MLYNQVLTGVKHHVKGAICQRNIGILAPCLQKATDPIQQLFVDKLREYNQKSGGGKNLVEPSPAIEKELKSELEKASKQYGGGPGVDMTKFPTFTFKEPVIDPINLEK
ncbi:ATP synthase-coupling factor 6, mitochondrial [Onthophagus taurus]|uniref:ATP synthase-coupling factor 6, mitochondrial n=1 Tax=Onthophagus taurus TaxID=166361 RepID=UPI000C20FBEE|nr:ATP synthase-coupling factor 6, mitochondrial [Onthophagus taurus]